MISVGIINRDNLTLLGLRYLIEEQRDMRIVLAVNRPLPLTGRSPDCLVIDLDLAGELPLILGGRDGARLPEGPQVIGLAGSGVLAEELTAVQLNAICRREDAAHALVKAVRGLTIPASADAGPRAAAAEVCLSPREEEVLRYV